MSLPLARILVADARAALAMLPDNSAHCCVTSPPYWALRDYGAEGQIGLEESFEAYIEALLEVFREVHRVLRPDGTLWLNLGDTYAGSGNGGGGSYMQERGSAAWLNKATINGWKAPPAGFKPKDLLGIPWRVAFALQAAGWWLRSDCIWHKPNPMPEAVTDRPTKSHEYMFLLSKSERYYYDSDAVREPVTGGAHTRGGGVGGKCVPPGKGPQGRVRQNESFGHSVRELVTSRNKRTVWTIPSQPYKGDHYATYPEELVRPCVLAGSSAAGCCAACGAPPVIRRSRRACAMPKSASFAWPRVLIRTLWGATSRCTIARRCSCATWSARATSVPITAVTSIESAPITSSRRCRSTPATHSIAKRPGARSATRRGTLGQRSEPRIRASRSSRAASSARRATLINTRRARPHGHHQRRRVSATSA